MYIIQHGVYLHTDCLSNHTERNDLIKAIKATCVAAPSCRVHWRKHTRGIRITN